MSYTVYSTEGIVLSRIIIGEATVLVRIYTRDYGALTLRAENGARSTKFAPSLQVGTIGVYDFVRSRNGYRLTGIRPQTTVQARSHDDDKIRFIRMCCAYIARFVSDEGLDMRLYILLVDALAFTRKNDWSSNWWNSFRLQVLQILGYIPDDVRVSSSSDVERLLQNVEITTHL